MRTYSGPFLTTEGFIQAEINIEGGKDEDDIWGDDDTPSVVDFEEGGDSGKPAVIIPTLYNAHTHVGDSVVKDVPKGNIPEVVGPGGLKFKALEKSSRDQMIKSIKMYLRKAVEDGIRDIIDFREDGVEGLSIIKEAYEDFEDDLRLFLMARPEKNRYNDWELNNLMNLSEGIGVSSYRDWDPDQLRRVAEVTKSFEKPFAMHCSEFEREPIEEVLSLGVHHLVHMIEATHDDLLACAIEDVPIVVCPRSNMFFGKIPDIPKMLDIEVKTCLGTDNAMLSSPNMFREMEVAYRCAKMKGKVDPLQILMMATWNPRKDLNLGYHNSQKESNGDARETYVILEAAGGKPAYDVVTKLGPRDIIEIVEW